MQSRSTGLKILFLHLAFALALLSPPIHSRGREVLQREPKGASGDTTYNQTDGNGRKQGFWMKRYPNGKVAYRAQFRDDRPVGRTLRYNEKGILIADLYHTPAGRKTKAKIYDDAGKLIATGNYVNQRKDSVWTLLSNGRVVAREGYALGEREGAWEYYSDEGQLAARERWRKGRLEGRQEKYYNSGALSSFWTAHDGLEDGPAATLYTSGRPKLTGQFAKGKREGVWLQHSVDGKSVDTLEYRRGELIRGTIQPNADSALNAMYKNAGKLREPTDPGDSPRSGYPYR